MAYTDGDIDSVPVERAGFREAVAIFQALDARLQGAFRAPAQGALSICNAIDLLFLLLLLLRFRFG